MLIDYSGRHCSALSTYEPPKRKAKNHKRERAISSSANQHAAGRRFPARRLAQVRTAVRLPERSMIQETAGLPAGKGVADDLPFALAPAQDVPEQGIHDKNPQFRIVGRKGMIFSIILRVTTQIPRLLPRAGAASAKPEQDKRTADGAWRVASGGSGRRHGVLGGPKISGARAGSRRVAPWAARRSRRVCTAGHVAFFGFLVQVSISRRWPDCVLGGRTS